MIILEFKLKGTSRQYQAIDEAVRTTQFIRNKCIRLWQDVWGTTGDDLNRYCRILAQEYAFVRKLNAMARQAAAERAWAAISRNNGAIPDLPPACAVEVPAVIDARGATPVVQGPLPLRVRGLVQHVKAYEQLTVQAAVTGDRVTAIWALVNNPLVGSYSAAAELADRLVEAHRAYLPAFAH